MTMTITYQGQDYELPPDTDLDLDEAEAIQGYVGRSLGDWSNGLSTCEIKSVRALWWLLRKRAGMPVRSVSSAPAPGFKPVALWSAWVGAIKAEADRIRAEQGAAEAAEEEVEPDPTSPAPSAPSPGPAGTTTTPVSAPAALPSPTG